MQPLLTSDPTEVGDYQLLARIGRGSMGGVYLARSRGGRMLAVKVVRADLAEDPEFRERFRREVAMARSVGGFWTAAVVDADPDAEQPWLATEYVPGPTLHRAVADHGVLPESTVRSLGAGLAEALAAIHQSGLVHRDMKPANVLLGPDGPRVIDFGISRTMQGSALTATGVFLGTPGFFSPEQTLGNDVGTPSDVFSLASVLVFAATGCSPFGDESTATLLYRTVHEEADLSGVPEQLRTLLAACLTKEPSQRPTADALVDRFGAPTPRGGQWLPPAINAAITEHNTQLQHAAAAPAPSPATGHPAGNTLVYSPGEGQPPHSGSPAPHAAAGPPAGVRQASASPATHRGTNPQGKNDLPDWSPRGEANPNPASEVLKQQFAKLKRRLNEDESAVPSASDNAATKRAGQIVPFRPKPTSPQSTGSVTVRKNQPGPVFQTGGRFAAFILAMLAFVAAVGIARISMSGTVQHVVDSAAVAMAVAGVLALIKTCTPRLHLKINTDGLRVSRAHYFVREIPWSRVSRIGLTGKGKKQAVTIWFSPGITVPQSTLWHRIDTAEGGVRVFPLGATGNWFHRRQEAKRVRGAMQQHGKGKYDNRLF